MDLEQTERDLAVFTVDLINFLAFAYAEILGGPLFALANVFGKFNDVETLSQDIGITVEDFQAGNDLKVSADVLNVVGDVGILLTTSVAGPAVDLVKDIQTLGRDGYQLGYDHEALVLAGGGTSTTEG